ncbi:hypothetical protein FBY10_105273 [Pseudomonas sp. SJZ103]|uniref:DUF6124 family protein n=1 Tax=unclassified Pseudomonas TaxID=196821 RepID=UPI0011AC3ADD|nr:MULTISPECIES: DUF6124 family protein [unclassified Pseudomonas]TWC70223.1 hypothetical protein FBY10_105273 [Pseudomonas sp. SJZ103]TWC87366.1 hypothetical protein FBY08_104106 [Pseudomonas sp. SJZ094]
MNWRAVTDAESLPPVAAKSATGFSSSVNIKACKATPFTLAQDISPETLLIQASETLASLNAMTTDLAFELEGANRHKLLGAQQLIVLGELLVERVLVLTQDAQTFQ